MKIRIILKICVILFVLILNIKSSSAVKKFAKDSATKILKGERVSVKDYAKKRDRDKLDQTDENGHDGGDSGGGYHGGGVNGNIYMFLIYT